MERYYLEFLKDAYNSGLCKDYRDEIRNCHDNKLNLAQLAMRQQSIPWMATKLNQGVVTKEEVKTFFKDYINGVVLNNCDNVEGYTYMWYIDNGKGFVIKADVTHISYCEDVDVFVPKICCPTIYVSNASRINLTCEGYSSVRIYLFDTSSVNIKDCDDTCNITIYKYSENSNVECGKYCLGQIKTFRKELRL